MKLPWVEDEEKNRKIEQLEQEVEKLEDKKQSYKERFEAEKERRSELASEKQRAEKRLNVLEQRLNTLEEKEAREEQEVEDSFEIREIGFGKAHRILKKLESVKSPENDFVTVYSPGKLSKINDFKGLKNAVSKNQLEEIQRHESFIGFLDQDIFQEVLKMRPFFGSNWMLDRRFEIDPVLEFIESEKTWVLVSAGDTGIYEEQAGEVEEAERISSRVDRKHSQGGFSQSRFERKREEQVQEHINQVKTALEDRRAVYLLGERDLCKKLPGDYLGGFDPNRPVRDELYKFRLVEQTSSNTVDN